MSDLPYVSVSVNALIFDLYLCGLPISLGVI